MTKHLMTDSHSQISQTFWTNSGDATTLRLLILQVVFIFCHHVKPDDILKRAFNVGNCNYKFVRRPFGINSAPATFQKVNDVTIM